MTFGIRRRPAALVWPLIASQMLACGSDPVGPPAVTPDSNARLLFIVSPRSPVPSGAFVSPPVQVTVTDGSGNTDVGFSGAVTIALDSLSPAGTLSGVRTAQASRGVAVFPALQVTPSGVGYAFTASADGRRNATSARFDVVRSSYLRFVTQPARFVAGDALAPAIQVEAVDPDDGGHPYSGEIAIRLAPNGSGAILSGTSRATAANGIATFADLRLDGPGSDFELVATADRFLDGRSVAFSSYLPALRFSVQPSRFIPGTPIAPAVQVLAQSLDGSIRTSFTGVVTLALDPSTNCGTLSGATQVTAVAGIANFAGLIMSGPAAGCILVATSPGLANATSSSFAAAGALTIPALTGATVGFPNSVVVTVRNGAGGTDISFNGPVTIALGDHPPGATLGGSLVSRAYNGVAYFSDLSLSTPGNGYTLVASTTVPGINAGVSTAFPVASTPWTLRAPPPTRRAEALGAVVDGKFYLVGGYDTDFYYYDLQYSPATEAYDPGTNTWSARASMPLPRAGMTTAVLNGKLYVIGGYASGALSRVDVYDPATNSWTMAAPMPTGRGGAAATAVNGRLYVAGGYNVTASQALESYDPATNTWTTHAPMLAPGGSSFTAAGLDGILYLAGGTGPLTGSGRMESYDPATNAWTARAPLPTQRDGSVAGVIGQEVFVVGGSNSGLVEAYGPAANTWRSAVALPRGSTVGVGFLNGTIYAVVGPRMYAYQP